MSNSNAFSHLAPGERRIIFTGIANDSTKTVIARSVGKVKFFGLEHNASLHRNDLIGSAAKRSAHSAGGTVSGGHGIIWDKSICYRWDSENHRRAIEKERKYIRICRSVKRKE